MKRPGFIDKLPRNNTEGEINTDKRPGFIYRKRSNSPLVKTPEKPKPPAFSKCIPSTSFKVLDKQKIQKKDEKIEAKLNFPWNEKSKSNSASNSKSKSASK